MNRALSYYSAEQKRAAKAWWNSLSGTERRYLTQYFKLGDAARRVRYWHNTIAPQPQAAGEPK